MIYWFIKAAAVQTLHENFDLTLTLSENRNDFKLNRQGHICPHFFIGVLLVSSVVVAPEAVGEVRVCVSAQGVNRLAVVADVELLCHGAVKGSVLLGLGRRSINTLNRQLLTSPCGGALKGTVLPASSPSLQPCLNAFGCFLGSPLGLTWRCL